MSTLFLDDTAWDILLIFSDQRILAARYSRSKSVYVLGSESLVVHEQKVDIFGIVNDESFVAGGH